jgi:hypothetical protein
LIIIRYSANERISYTTKPFNVTIISKSSLKGKGENFWVETGGGIVKMDAVMLVIRP